MKGKDVGIAIVEAISLWPQFWQAALLCILPPICSCVFSMGILAITVRAHNLFADFSTNIPITLLSAIGCLLWIMLKRARLISWLPAILLFITQTVIVAIAKPVSEWIYAIPSYLYTTGTPIFSVLMTRKLATQIKFDH
jgi:hypothetical protein